APRPAPAPPLGQGPPARPRAARVGPAPRDPPPPRVLDSSGTPSLCAPPCRLSTRSQPCRITPAHRVSPCLCSVWRIEVGGTSPEPLPAGRGLAIGPVSRPVRRLRRKYNGRVTFQTGRRLMLGTPALGRRA